MEFVRTLLSKDDSEVIAQKLLPAMKVALDCGTAQNDSCFYSGRYKYLNGNYAVAYGGNNIYKIVLMNGTSMAIAHWSDSERIDFYVDTNGNRPPNVIGRDMFCISWFKIKDNIRLELQCLDMKINVLRPLVVGVVLTGFYIIRI